MRALGAAAAVGVGLLAGLGTFTFHYAHGTSYLANDPKACANCHVMQEYFDSWVKSSHRTAATCNDCHVPHAFPAKYVAKMRNGWNHSKAFTLQNFPEPIRISPKNLQALQANCLHCHGDLVSEVAGHGDDRSRAVPCTGCHASVGHLRLQG